MLIYLPSGPHGEKVGADDYLARGHSVDDMLSLATAEIRRPPDESDEQDLTDAGRTHADILVAIGQAGDLFHDATGTAYTRMPVDGHHEVWPLNSKRFKQWLRRMFFGRTGKAVGAEAVNAAGGTLEGLAVYDGPTEQLFNRVGIRDGVIHYDLADKDWRTVVIDANGWEVRSLSTVLFRRYAHQQSQVEPSRTGDIRRALSYLNVEDEDHLLLLAWLVTAFVPDIPHAIPDFHGEKGAGKSVGQRVLRKLIDPSSVESLSFPSDMKELVQQLSHHYAPVYDNVDNVPPWLSDVLCRAVTGEGFTKRELYSDDDDVIYAYRRVVMLNGINVVPRRADLLDRSLLLRLERISKQARRSEKEFWQAFEMDRPVILGGIFDTLSAALRIYPEVEPTALERMADFTRFGAAVAVALGYSEGAFLDAYASNIGAQTVEAVEGNIVGAAILELMKTHDEWRGTPSAFLEDLEEAGNSARLFRRSASGKVESKGWPGAPHILSRRINDIRSNLRDLGIEIVESHGDERTIIVRRLTGDTGESSVGSVGSDGGRRMDERTTDGTDATNAELPTSEGEPWEMKI
ncbi:MAG: hypothetical protein WEB52_02855 [Dehalococcoidia bacterium]